MHPLIILKFVMHGGVGSNTDNERPFSFVPSFPVPCPDVALRYYQISYQIPLGTYFMYYAETKGSGVLKRL